MVIRRVPFAALLAFSVVAAAPTAASPGRDDGWLGWLSRTAAEALKAVAGDGEPDLGDGGELLFDRGIGTVGSQLRRVAPVLGRLDADLRLDGRASPAYGLALTQPLLHAPGRALDLESSIGYQPDGPTRQAVALGYRRTAGLRSAGLAPTMLTVELARHGHAVSDDASQAVSGDIAWTGLEIGGGLRADRRPGSPRIDNAHAHLTAALPPLRWVEIETGGRWSTRAAGRARLVMSEATYLVRACPFGPLELTAGRRNGGAPEPDWFTRLQLRVTLGGGG